MRKFQGTFITCFLVLIAVSLPLNSAPGEANNQTVQISKLKIKGADHVSIKEIKERIGTEFPSIKPWAKDPKFQKEILKNKMVKIQRLKEDPEYYAARGK